MAINVSPLIPTETQPGYVASSTSAQVAAGSDDTTFVSPLKAAVNYVGYYRATRTYGVNTVCFFGSQFWRALTSNLGVSPVEGPNWTSTTASIPNATNTVYGLTRVANNTEIEAGTSDKVVTVAGLKHAADTAFVQLSGDQNISGTKTFEDRLVAEKSTGEARVEAEWTGVTNPSSTYVYSTSGSGGLYDSVYGSIVYVTKGVGPTVTVGGSVASIKFRANNTEVGSINSTGNLTTMGDSYFNGVRVGKGLGTNTASNTALGNNTLGIIGSGYANTALGYYALSINTTGYFNTALGAHALKDNTDGSFNTALGSDSLTYNTQGQQNTAVGASSLAQNTTGLYNTAVGSNALSLSNGESNTAVGAGSMFNNTIGNANTAVGAVALSDNTSGLFNTAVGFSALEFNIGGADNTAVGVGALQFETSYNECTGLGAYTFVTGNSQNQIGKMGTTTYVYGTVQSRSDVRDKADVRDTVLGLDFINKLRPVDYKWDMRDSYRTPAPERTYAPKDASPEEVLRLEEAYREEVLKWREQNDINNIQRDGSKKRNRYHHGLIAQEVQDLISSTGVDFGGFQDHAVSGGKDVLSIGYDELIAPLIKAVQELSAQVQKLKDQLASQ